MVSCTKSSTWYQSKRMTEGRASQSFCLLNLVMILHSSHVLNCVTDCVWYGIMRVGTVSYTKSSRKVHSVFVAMVGDRNTGGRGDARVLRLCLRPGGRGSPARGGRRLELSGVGHPQVPAARAGGDHRIRVSIGLRLRVCVL